MTEEKGLEKLQESYRQLVYTLALSENINMNLQKQQNQLKNINNNTKEISENNNKSNSILRKMIFWGK